MQVEYILQNDNKNVVLKDEFHQQERPGLPASQSFFKNLSQADQGLVRARCSSRRVKKGEVVVRQGGRDRELYIVVSGRLRISAISEAGKEISFGILQEDDTFGEMSMLDAEPRSATITAIEPCELLVLDRPSFDDLVAEHPQLAIRMMVILSQRLRRTTRVYEDAVFLDVSARLARFLLQFSSRKEDVSGEHWVFEVKLSQYEMGTLINASRESVNKLMSEWEAAGIIEKIAGGIRIADRERLQELTVFDG